MDTSRILQSTIPDIAAVYGGVRGRTLSSRHLGWAWQMLVEGGVKTVIELRSEDSSQGLPLKCASSGLRYFHFPVHKRGQSAPQMVALFEEFCEIIDGGDFYIACAQGLHRTDIALCTYWMFHGADNGCPQPDLRGYLESEGKDIDKIYQTLNAFYRCKTEHDGVPPIPEAVFKERKQLIKESWKEKV